MTTQSDQDALMAELLEEHQRDPHPNLSGERLRLHVAIHSVVEIQLRDGTPPETRAALQRLIADGLDRHEAAHAIGTVVADEMSAIMSQGRRYDEASYVERLRALSAESYRQSLCEREGD
jgi:hypothetical protein